jgi:4-alpha-glucanotransferase
VNDAGGAFVPPSLASGGRVWGFALNLYTLRSARNWGIGDFSDLRAFVRASAGLGARVVGINPLHALHDLDPTSASPYSPTSRFFLNPLYVDVEAIPEYAEVEARLEPGPRAELRRELEALRESRFVEYERVAALKRTAFRASFAAFRKAPPERRAAFASFRAAGGERLENFALYEALDEYFSERGSARGWLSWPEDYREPGSAAVARFAGAERARIDYFLYVQWLATAQLDAANAEARGLGIGLYFDLAVGVWPGGADVWSDRPAFVFGKSIGAPPDPLGPDGQDWGFPPPDPAALAENGGARYAALLAANMRHAAALRLDHAMALQRLFLIPFGGHARDGTYVDYPFELLLSVLARESERAGCLVVGEDLGTVADGFRERMGRARILSYRLLEFERWDDGSFKPPEDYPQLALATTGTHDLPTLPGWALGRDIALRRDLGLLPPEDAERELARRNDELGRLLEALVRHGALSPENAAKIAWAAGEHDPNPDSYRALVVAAYRYLAGTPAALVIVQLDDVLLEFDQVNVPGTALEYPNWRRRLTVELDAIATNETVVAVAAELRERVAGGSLV